MTTMIIQPGNAGNNALDAFKNTVFGLQKRETEAMEI